MKQLFDGKFAPITCGVSFIEAGLDSAASAFVAWKRSVPAYSNVQARSFDVPFREAIAQLSFLDDQGTRELMLETRSGWTAVFSNHVSEGAPTQICYMLCPDLKCRGVGADLSPRTITRDKTKRGLFGGIGFVLFGPERTDWLNIVRAIAISRASSGADFRERGEIQPFEQVEKYSAKKKLDRFTPDMLEAYCAALGIRLFDEDFYGPRGVLVTVEGPVVNRRVSLSEWQKELQLDRYDWVTDKLRPE